VREDRLLDVEDGAVSDDTVEMAHAIESSDGRNDGSQLPNPAVVDEKVKRSFVQSRISSHMNSPGSSQRSLRTESFPSFRNE